MVRFILRDLLWLAVLAALAVSWYLDRARLDAVNGKLKAHVQLLEEDNASLRWTRVRTGNPSMMPAP